MATTATATATEAVAEAASRQAKCPNSFSCQQNLCTRDEPFECSEAQDRDNGAAAVIDMEDNDDDDDDDDRDPKDVPMPEVDYLQVGDPPPTFRVWPERGTRST